MANIINIAKDYGTTLGGRWIRLGQYSGEEFYDRILKPKYLEAKDNSEKLIVELDGTNGYPSSFLDQSFGELARKYGVKDVRNTIEFKTSIFSWIVDFINREIWDKAER